MMSSPHSRFPRALLPFMFAGLIATGLSTHDARAQGAPDSVSFQGFLTNPGGSPLDSTVSITFKLYKNGTAVWTETQPSVNVMDGLLNVLLGSVTPLDTVAFNQPMELGIKVGDDPETAPRTPLGATAFALGMRGMYAVWRQIPGAVSYNIVGGAPNNSVANDISGATISGGGGFRNEVPQPNSVTDDFGTVSGGAGNEAGGHGSTVGGGVGNTASSLMSTVSGGIDNQTSGQAAVVGGGQANVASGHWSVIAGGTDNGTGAGTSAVGGGWKNQATGNSSVVPGGESNKASGSHSFAAGQGAKAKHSNTFVWSDGATDSLVSTGDDQFIIRAGGGVGINRNDPDFPIHVGVSMLNGNGAHVTDAGSWTNGSSRTFKHGFEEIDKTELLQRLATLSVTKWRYNGEDEFSHIGPVAEEFRAAFGLGHDDRYITTVDAEGVALAAIQGLYELVLAQQREIEALKKGPAPVWSPLDER